MMSKKTIAIRTDNHFGALLMLALVVIAAILLAASRPVHANTPFVVNSVGDQPDADTTDNECVTSNDSCTLRAAIQQANVTTGADVINFAISGSGVQTITPSANAPLPQITTQVTIDGYTQTDASPNTKTVGDDASLKIQLDGTNVPGECGLSIVGSSNSVIKGLVINRFGFGICTEGNSTGNRIQGNFIGTTPSGISPQPNHSEGLEIFGSSQTVVGGSTVAARNIISSNEGSGVFLDTANATQIKGNYIGTDKSGNEDLGNTDHGVEFQNDSPDTTIGGTTAASRNVISGNNKDGLNISGTQGTKVLGNRIGTTASGTNALGNDGFGVYLFCPHNLVGDGTADGSNTIAFNGEDGVVIGDGNVGNELSHNSIFANAGLGIDLLGPGENLDTNIPTPNDAYDSDSGANNLQNKPVLSSAKTGALKTTIKGKLTSIADKRYTIEFYSNPADTNEGKTFIGEQEIKTSVDGLRSFTFSPATKVPVGREITATATRVYTHDTSEFSAPRKVASS